MIIMFLGHSKIHSSKLLYEKIKNAILKNVKRDEEILFYCGHEGDFDFLSAKACRAVSHAYEDCEVVLITPYSEGKEAENKISVQSGFHETVIYPPLENMPYRIAIYKRNKWMIGQAELIISYVTHPTDRSYKYLEYAKKIGKQVINLADI